MQVEQDGGFVSPAARNVLDGVASSTDDEKGKTKRFDEAYALAVRRDGKVEASEAIAAKRVGATLKDDGRRLEGGDGGFHDALEQGDVALVVNAVLQWDVETEVFAQRVANFVDMTCTEMRY